MHQHRGFVNGRMLVDNLIDMDTEARAAVLNSANSAAIFFFDYAAAFSSIAREYLWLVLGLIGLPVRIISAIKGLYRNNRHYFRHQALSKAVP